MVRRQEQPRGQGGSIGDEYITYEVGSNKPRNLARWLNDMNANGYELVAMDGYGGGGSAHLMAVVRRKKR